MNARTFLFLQGPASPFFRLVADRLEATGAKVKRINFCLGDMAFWWPKRGNFYRGSKKNWPAFLASYIRHHAVTDLVMLGDGRDYHAAAADFGIAEGIRVHVIEHGYLRPDWLTIEPDGMSAHSRFPQEPDAIRKLAEGAPAVDRGGLFRSSFLTYALYDLVYHIPNVVPGALLHPHYRTHGAAHPIVEYSGWVWKAVTARRRRAKAERAIAAATTAPTSGAPRFFLFPLQLPGDYQIIRHAPGGDLFAIVEAVIASFTRHAPSETRLLFKVHPIDNGLSRWPERIEKAARRLGVSGRVFLADGGDTERLIERSAGVVTVNSTVGLTALALGRPVIALGSAIYDVAGLTSQAPLSDFWRQPPLPDADLFDAFMRALAVTTQVRGGFIGKAALKTGADNVAARLLDERERLPESWRKMRNRGVFRYQGELFG
ncbi:capsular biosynthesis protein [Neorhizobium sp. NCHU2750]|uniref:capsule biosynthesis protein n=1 Tax=Neorhizobium sp. NCHU2750 TaxID=1825976 RepID=UPI000E766795|nr:capsule polysaccharide biosynthesis protein [Neorhizobium sp. NCHU2750]